MCISGAGIHRDDVVAGEHVGLVRGVRKTFRPGENAFDGIGGRRLMKPPAVEGHFRNSAPTARNRPG